MAEAAGVPIPHNRRCRGRGPRSHRDKARIIGLMGTPVTLRTKLYQQRLTRLGWDCVEPTEDQMVASSPPRSPS